MKEPSFNAEITRLTQRLQMARQNAVVVQPGQQLLHRQQRVNLVFAEPQARQFMHSARSRHCGVEAIAIGIAVIDDGRTEPIAQVLQVAFQRGWGHLQLVAESRKTHAATAAQSFSCREYRCSFEGAPPRILTGTGLIPVKLGDLPPLHGFPDREEAKLTNISTDPGKKPRLLGELDELSSRRIEFGRIQVPPGS